MSRSIIRIDKDCEKRKKNGEWPAERRGHYRPKITYEYNGRQLISTFSNGECCDTLGIWVTFTREFAKEYFGIDEPCALGGWDGTKPGKNENNIPHIYKFRWSEKKSCWRGYPIPKLDNKAKEYYDFYKDQI